MEKKYKTKSRFIEEVKRLKLHDHLCHTYATQEEWSTTVSAFLMIGLRQGEKCVYVVDTHTTDQVRALLREQGVDVTTAEVSGQLVILHETEAYTREGFFNPDRMIAFLVTETEVAIAEGYHALRVTGEMSWVLRGYPGSERFIEYEAKLNRDFFHKYPSIALCQYEWRLFDLSLLLDMLCTHPIIIAGMVVYDNPYYVPAAEFLNRKHSLADLCHWMDRLVKLKQTEEREEQLRQELRRSRRLASIGELAATVAHEINNPLTGIIGFSERLLKKSTDEEISRDLGRIHSEARRMAKVVENLLTFARRRELKKEYSDINDILQKVLELRAYELKTSNIKVVTNLTPRIPKIMVDYHQIQQVFMNLIVNAEQAMTETKGGGKLSVETQKVKGCIRVSFTDDGPGIPDEHLDKLFDLFFTTRGKRVAPAWGLVSVMVL